ncbi:DUF3027 domain-containing protein [Nocardia sp. NPDC056000]|uniref:DUF3027 domain-containing protein n=1 Tax=Nocardia sp. NPDC056000 TaxID=3345674 RepID=UPI0035DE9A36
MSAVGVSESGVRPILAEAVDLARRALLELEPLGVGRHIGVTAEDDSAATHHFEATLPGYRGWQWAVVVAAPPEATRVTVSESALLPGPDALVAPDFLPWDQRIRPGDLAPGDLLAPPLHDPRLVPGYIASGDPVVDEVALELGLGRPRVLSREGREEAADRWFSEFGPDTDMARAAPATCGTCGFFVPLAGGLRAAFGVCANAMGADGRVVSLEYGCGAHSDTELPTGAGSPAYEAFDDAAVEIIPAEELRKPEAVAAEDDSAPAGEATAKDITAAAAHAEDITAAAAHAESTPVDTTPAEAASPDSASAETATATTEVVTAADATSDAVAAEPADTGSTPTAAVSAPADPSPVSEPTEVATNSPAPEANSSTTSSLSVASDAVASEGASSTSAGTAPVVAEAIAESATAEAITAVAEVAAVTPIESEIPQVPADNGIPTLFDLADPDMVVDDAWGVSAVRVEAETATPQIGDPGASESH